MSVEIEILRFGITNVVLLRDRGTVVIDPAGWPGGRALRRRLLPRLGRPPRLDLILITHVHFDHVGGVPALRDATRAPVAVHAADAGWLRTGHLAIPAGVTPWGGFMSSALRALPRGVLRVPPIEPDLVIDDSGLDLAPWGVEGRVVHTPGHTPGSVSVLLPGGDGFVGDLAMNGPPLCLRPSFGVLAHEPERVPESWRRLLALGLRRAYPAHGHPFEASALRA